MLFSKNTFYEVNSPQAYTVMDSGFHTQFLILGQVRRRAPWETEAQKPTTLPREIQLCGAGRGWRPSFVLPQGCCLLFPFFCHLPST